MSESEITEQVRKYRAIIIFANQRTGSTQLCEWFAKKHKKYIDYESLNQAVVDLGYKVDVTAFSKTNEIFDIHIGAYRDVINQYHKDKDLEKLELVIKTIMSFRPSFKVINEHTDIEVIELISKYINYYHYSAIFLYRRKTIKRLLSMWFSSKTGIYHPYDKDKIDKFLKSKKSLPKLDVNYLIDWEKHCIEQNNKIWKILQTAWCRYIALSYEDLFSDMADSTILHISFRWIFYNLWDFTELKQTGKSNFDKYYYEIEGIDKLEKAVDELPRPTFSNMHVDV